MEEWNKAKNKFRDSAYDTASFITAKSVSTEVYHELYYDKINEIIINCTHKFFLHVSGLCG